MAKLEMKMGNSPKRTRSKGHLNITSMDIKEVKDWNIGDKIEVVVELEVVGLRKPDRWEIEEGILKDSVNINSDIISIKAKSNATKK